MPAVQPTNIYTMLTAVDMGRAVRFWTETFGLAVKEQSDEWSELTFGNAIVAFHGGDDMEPQPNGLGFDVDDIEQAMQAVVSAGGAAVWGPNAQPEAGIVLAMVGDTEGNQFMLSAEYKP